MNDKKSTDLRKPVLAREEFWGSTGWTPVKNRLYPSYPFGWHSMIQKPDFPRCPTLPYSNTDYLKAQIAKLDNVKPARIGDLNLAYVPNGDGATAPIEWENKGNDRETARQLDHMTRGRPVFLEGEPFIDIRLNKATHREIIRSALIITAIAFTLLSLFHIYG